MESKAFSIDHRRQALLLALLISVWIVGCATKHPAPLPQPPPAGESIDASHAAARELIERGRSHLANGRPDAAIRELERALSLNPSDGRTVYYLAEAWLMKTDAERAEQFNRLAEDRFKDDPEWLRRIARQADRIAELRQ